MSLSPPRPSLFLLGMLVFSLVASPAIAQQTQVNTSHHFGPGECGPVDPSYIRVANETGGQPMFFQRSEVAKSMRFMELTHGENHDTILWATDQLAGSSREFALPMDSTLERATITLSTDTHGTNLIVTHPSGAEVTAGDAATEITEFNCGRLVTVTKPEAGIWHARVAGSGRFWIQATSKSPMFLTGVEFVRLGGRIGHEGMFRIPGQPLAGSPASLELRLSGTTRSVAFKLITESGETIKPFKMRAIDKGRDDTEYAGTFDLPRGPFRVAVKGTDENGAEFQRVFPTLFHAENVEVAADDPLAEGAPPGGTATLSYTVRNVGPAATFHAKVVEINKFVKSAEPVDFALESGASAKILVELAVPDSARVGTRISISIVVTSTSGPATQNGTAQFLEVLTPRP